MLSRLIWRHVCDLEVSEFLHTLGGARIYQNHLEQVQLLSANLYPCRISKSKMTIKNCVAWLACWLTSMST
jgi:thymidylate synthase